MQLMRLMLRITDKRNTNYESIGSRDMLPSRLMETYAKHIKEEDKNNGKIYGSKT
jgi:hypothetical protein